MLSHQTVVDHHSSLDSKRKLRFGFHPPQAWLAILAFGLLSFLAIWVRAGEFLNLAFPAGAFIVGLFLYFRYPLLYLGFTWWLWFLSPLVRRLIDYQSRFTDPSPILLTPYLVTLITLLTVVRHLPKIDDKGKYPFILAFSSVIYGYFLGLVQLPPVSATIELLDWLAPVLLGFYFYIHWRDYPSYCRNLQRVFVWGVLLTGCYGILQFLIAPEWDQLWLINVGLNSVGRPEPLGIRVWSTMNAPGPFSIFMMTGLILLFLNKSTLKLPALAVGYLAFLLSLVRSSWGGWGLGLLILASSMKLKFQVRLLLNALLIVLLVVPLVTIEPFSDVIHTRFETLSNIEEDNSGAARRAMYSEQLGPALSTIVGKGIGSPGFDSGFINTLLSLGWLGTVLYMGAILILIFHLFNGAKRCPDPFVKVCQSIVLPLFAMLLFGSTMIGIPGVLTWAFLSLGMAAQRYHKFINQDPFLSSQLSE
ncbi:O-antigen ligase domain-containing protein [Thermocoleostomius sinensis]|uniref:O-antigen ligase domain-containing protein n=1 Tax=Thermocoleostomius sinensis A174 TaxID=2016057 RepID=A0A9E8Z9R3_9CYAN|nr:O-antigen ligase domain-containing protein [Thermocoleostomius sinensis]WAL59158.1 O-antigen ligase domain-containing protein [Thermocoleostomius sinensis A174]